MTSFILQFLDVFKNGHFQIYFFFFIFVFCFWWLRVYIASKNKRYEEPFKGTYSVMVAVLREDHDLFEKCLSSIKEHSSPEEFIVTIDDYGHADKELKRIAKKYATSVIEMPSLVGKREQYAIASNSLKKDVDVLITVDSATIWDETTINILKPFEDEKVGAVSGRQTIFDANRNWIRRTAQWFEDLRFRVTLPFQSYFGQVNVIPGRTLAARAEIYKKVAATAVDERFLGRRIITSDDATVTMDILKAGYKVVYQDDSEVTTDAPDTLYRFWKQYLRWYRGAYRRFFHRFGQIMRMNPLVVLSNIEFLFLTFIYAGILATFIFKLNFRIYEFLPIFGFELTESFTIGFILLLVIGYFVSSYIRNIPHLKHNKRDILFLPVFATLTFIIMLPLKLISMFTFFENGWMTRSSDKKHKEHKVLLTRTVAATAALLVVVLTVPIAYLTDIAPSRVPLSTIVAQEGPEYFKAREIIASYQGEDNNESLQNIAHLYEDKDKLNGTEPNNEINQIAAQCAESKLLDNAQSFNINEPLKAFDECKTFADVAYAEKQKTEEVAVLGESTDEPEANVTDDAPIVLTALMNDSLSKMSRLYINADADSQNLSSAQKAFLENRLTNALGNSSYIYVGQSFTLDSSVYEDLLTQARALNDNQIQAWSRYVYQ